LQVLPTAEASFAFAISIAAVAAGQASAVDRSFAELDRKTMGEIVADKDLELILHQRATLRATLIEDLAK
jgi:hypothetical protein